MHNQEYNYLILLNDILLDGNKKSDRTGTGTRSLFGKQIEFNLANEFPLLTTKKLHIKSIVHELLWMIKGDTNTKYLNDNGVTIWDEWADKHGELGPVYGKQWRKWPRTVEYDYGQVGPTFKEEPVDQLLEVQESLRNNPDSRRHIVSAWNVADIPNMKLPPCHCLFQFYVANGTLSCHLYQRSADVFLGVPFNIASYALLTCMMAQTTGLKPGRFIHTFGDVHLYNNHEEQAQEQLARTPNPLPQLKLNPQIKNITDFTFDDIRIVNYMPYPPIKAPVAI